jgi:hypothetical protein
MYMSQEIEEVCYEMLVARGPSSPTGAISDITRLMVVVRPFPGPYARTKLGPFGVGALRGCSRAGIASKRAAWGREARDALT